MLLQIAFFFYCLLFILTIFLLGLNTTRIRITYLIHPRTICFIAPIIMHYLISNFIFRSINPLIAVLSPSIIAYLLCLKMQKIRIIGLTGSIATGKSTLTKLIKTNIPSIKIIDCDQISRKLRKKNESGYKLIVSLLGTHAQQYINPLTQQIQQQQRKKLNQYVFNNKIFRDKLTRQMGILILKNICKQIIKNIIIGQNVMLIDAPLLFQTKILQYICYPIVLVGCSEQIQIKRLMLRDGYNEQQAKNRIGSQMPISKKIKKSQIYINNQSTQNYVIQQFSEKVKKYLSSEIPHYKIIGNKDQIEKKKRQDIQQQQQQ